MKLGFVSALFPELDLEEVLEIALDIGYDCVEVMCWPVGRAERRYAGVTHVDVTNFSDADAKRIQKMVDSTGVEISALGYYPNPLAPDSGEARQSVEHIRRVMDATKMLGLPTMTSFVGRDWTKSVDANWPQFVDNWRPLVEYAEKLDIRIGIENCPMLFSADEWPGGKNLATTPAIWRRMYADIPSRHFGLNFDPSHLIWQQMDYLKPLREFADRLFHVHAKDVRMDRHRLDDVGILGYPNQYHTPKIPGLGDVNWSQFFSVLTDVGYEGPVCVEVEDRAFEGTLEKRKASLLQSHSFLQSFIPC